MSTPSKARANETDTTRPVDNSINNSAPSPGRAPATHHEQNVTQVWIAIISVVLVLAGMRAAASVLVPLVFAIFLIALFWPLQRRLQERMPRAAAAGITLLAFLLVVSAIGAALYYSGYRMVQQWPEYQEQFTQYYQQVQNWAQQIGVSAPNLGGGGGSSANSSSGASGLVLTGAGQVASFLGAAVLVIAFLLLGLLEVDQFGDKLHGIREQREPGKREANWWGSIRKIAEDFQLYILVRTGVGLLTGVLVYIGALLIGLDLGFVWGLANFVLNYIPTLGSIVAVVPPVLFALVQFERWTMALVVLAVIGGAQILMGMVVGPLVQGKYLELSSMVVLFSVVFWGWLWGIVGALIAVPLTILITITCSQFERTQWIARLLAGSASIEKLQRDIAKAE